MAPEPPVHYHHGRTAGKSARHLAAVTTTQSYYLSATDSCARTHPIATAQTTWWIRRPNGRASR